MSDVELGLVSLKEFVKHHPNYIKVCSKEGKLEGSTGKFVKVDKKEVCINVRFETSLELDCISSIKTPKFPDIVHLHNTETLLTLLAHYPERLRLEYWSNNNSTYMDKKEVQGRTLKVSGYKGKRVFTVQLDNIHPVLNYLTRVNAVSI